MGGGDKCLRLLGGEPVLVHVIARARPQVESLLLNANGDPARFAPFGLSVVADAVPGSAGPLAGILTGLEWVAQHAPCCPWVASFATDTPFLPHDLVVRLYDAVRAGAPMAYAASAGRAHPVFGLWPVRLAAALRAALVDGGIRKVDAWTVRYRAATVTFADTPFDPFFNVNTPADLERAVRWVPGGQR